MDQGAFTLFERVEDEGQVEERGEHHVEFLEAREHPPKALEPTEKPFDLVTPSIEEPAALPRAAR